MLSMLYKSFERWKDAKQVCLFFYFFKKTDQKEGEKEFS